MVIGIGASGFDNAACALEAGAAEVRILARAPAMPRVNKAKSIRERESDDLRREIAAAERKIWELRFQEGSEKAGDPSKIRQMRRDVARMMTILRERELGIERGQDQ